MNRRAFLFVVFLAFCIGSVSAAPTDYTAANYPFNVNYSDIGPFNSHLTPTSMNINTTLYKLGNGSATFAPNAGSYLAIPASFNFSQNKSLSVWLYKDIYGSGVDEDYIMSDWAGGAFNLLLTVYAKNGSIRICNGNGAAADCKESNLTLGDRAWTHFVLSRNETNVKMWINGSIAMNWNSAYNGTGSTPVANHKIGADNTAGTEYGFNGTMDDWTFFNASLNQNDVDILFNSGSGQTYPFGGGGGGPVSTLSVKISNIVNGTVLAGLCANVTNTTTSAAGCNVTGTTVFFNSTQITGTLNITVYNVTNHFNASRQNYAFTADQTVTLNTSQALVSLQAYRLFLNTSITSLNATNGGVLNTTAASTVLVPANNGSNNIQVAVAGNHSRNVTCTVTTPLSTAACNATGIHDAYYSFNATDRYTPAQILNFTIGITNATLGGLLYQNTTTTGLLNFSVLQGYNYSVVFTPDAGLYEYTNVTVRPTAAYQNYQFSVLPTPSINITILDASTALPITQNVTITFTSNTTGEVVYTTTSGYFKTDLEPEQYTIKLANSNYSQSVYVVTALGGAVYYLTAYLQSNATSDVVMQFVDSIASTVTIPGATVTQQLLVNGSWQSISTKLTDITGRTIFSYLDDTAYRFIATADGYTSKVFDLDPVLFSTYTIKMSRSTALESDTDFQSVYIGYSPKIFYNAQANQINITFNSPLGTFTEYTYVLAYPGGTNTSSGTNVNGETFTVGFNIAGAHAFDTVNITLSYDTGLGDTRTFNYTHQIIVNAGNQTFIANQDNTYGLGLLERILIGTLMIVIAAGLVTLGGGTIIGVVMALFLMGTFVSIGFWPWWAAGISFLVGFALAAGRTD